MKTTYNGSHIFGSDDRPVFQIIIYCLSFAFAVLIASLQTLQSADSGLRFAISRNTYGVLIISALIFVPCFKIIFLSPSKKRRVAVLGLIVVIGLLSFLYPLRFVPAEKFAAIFTGLSIALCVLSTIGGILFLINRFLNADERRTALEADLGTLSEAANKP